MKLPEKRVMKRVTHNLPGEDHKLLKELSESTGTSVTELINYAISYVTDGIKNHRALRHILEAGLKAKVTEKHVIGSFTVNKTAAIIKAGEGFRVDLEVYTSTDEHLFSLNETLESDGLYNWINSHFDMNNIDIKGEKYEDKM